MTVCRTLPEASDGAFEKTFCTASCTALKKGISAVFGAGSSLTTRKPFR